MRLIKILLFSVLGGVILTNTACAQSSEEYVEGKHYRVLSSPVPTQTEDGIEIAELFSYTCGHCFTFESLSRNWKKDLPAGVNFVYSPAMWNGGMEVMAQAFYTARTLGVLGDVHQALFNTIHLDRNMPRGAEDIAEVFAEYGVDKEETIKTFNSFGVRSLVKQADARFRGANPDGGGSTPSLLVNGTYVIEAQQGVVSQRDMMLIASYLVEKIQAGEM